MSSVGGKRDVKGESPPEGGKTTCEDFEVRKSLEQKGLVCVSRAWGLGTGHCRSQDAEAENTSGSPEKLC